MYTTGVKVTPSPFQPKVGCPTDYLYLSVYLQLHRILSIPGSSVFKLCKNMTVSGISILTSNGTGFAFLDTVGKVEIANSDISDTPGEQGFI